MTKRCDDARAPMAQTWLTQIEGPGGAGELSKGRWESWRLPPALFSAAAEDRLRTDDLLRQCLCRSEALYVLDVVIVIHPPRLTWANTV